MKSKELLLKHLTLNDCKGYVTSDGRLYKAIIDALDEALTIGGVGCSLPSKNEKLIGNMCLSFRHDFGLLPKLIQEDLKRDCKNWLISYENNIK